MYLILYNIVVDDFSSHRFSLAIPPFFFSFFLPFVLFVCSSRVYYESWCFEWLNWVRDKNRISHRRSTPFPSSGEVSRTLRTIFSATAQGFALSRMTISRDVNNRSYTFVSPCFFSPRSQSYDPVQPASSFHRLPEEYYSLPTFSPNIYANVVRHVARARASRIFRNAFSPTKDRRRRILLL